MEGCGKSKDMLRQRTPSIKTMKLYSHVERIYNELDQLGFSPEDSLDVKQVCQFDQYHYHGTQAVAEAARKLGINSSHHVLDIGSGLGGPSRFLAHLTGCQVTAVEIQEDLHLVASDLTKRCGLSDKVHHMHGDILEMDTDAMDRYDFIVSWLVFLHITEKDRLFQKCFSLLKPQGKIYIEDFFSLGKFDEEETQILKKMVYVKSDPPTSIQYSTHLENAGFSQIQLDDVTQDWGKFCHQRSEAYRESMDRQVKVHGKDVFNEQNNFFSAMDSLFAQGNLGGCKIIATKGNVN